MSRSTISPILVPIAGSRSSSPAPRVEGGNDGLHGDESMMMMGEAVDKEMASANGDGVAISWLGPRLSMVKIVRWARGCCAGCLM